jgi:chromosome segregation ATPase
MLTSELMDMKLEIAEWKEKYDEQRRLMNKDDDIIRDLRARVGKQESIIDDNECQIKFILMANDEVNVKLQNAIVKQTELISHNEFLEKRLRSSQKLFNRNDFLQSRNAELANQVKVLENELAQYKKRIDKIKLDISAVLNEDTKLSDTEVDKDEIPVEDDFFMEEVMVPLDVSDEQHETLSPPNFIEEDDKHVCADIDESTDNLQVDEFDNKL